MQSHLSARTVIARHPTVDGEIQLQQRQQPNGAQVYEIIVDGVFLMASYNQASERALAARVLPAAMKNPDVGRRVLIGGLGMGYTLQTALTFAVTAVDVVELNAHVIAWNRTHFAPLNDDALTDPRVAIVADDLFAVMGQTAANSYCAILLDVDNGPSWLAHTQNARLYTVDALARWSTRLTPGGIFAVWSAQPEPKFLQRLKSVFDAAVETVVVANEGRGEPVETYIYQGVKRDV